MPLERAVADAIVSSMEDAGWILVSSLASDVPNPVQLDFHYDQANFRLYVYARRFTPQSGATTDHHRPAGELHAQMIFDDSRRGAGIRNHLFFEEGAVTVLLGYYPKNSDYIFVAYDPSFHQEYAYSKSLQVRDSFLEAASQYGIAFHKRGNGEAIVAFPSMNFPEYIQSFDTIHTVSQRELLKDYIDEGTDIDVINVLATAESGPPVPPELLPQERKEIFRRVRLRLRNQKFSRAMRLVYPRCAICGFQYGDILDGAHIIPVNRAESTDEYDNGLGLCPRCHRMYDKGYILVDGEFAITLHPQYAAEFQARGLAGNLHSLEEELPKTLYLPDNEAHWPSRDKLQLIFDERSK